MIFTLNYKDFVKGAVLAIITAILVYAQQVIAGGTFDWKLLLSTTLTAFIAYLLKNFASDSEGTFLGKK